MKNIKTSTKSKNYNSKTFLKGFLKDISKQNRIILMSSEEDSLSYGSIFSHHLIYGFKGQADYNTDKIVTAEEAFNYTKNFFTYNTKQKPTILDNYPGEFPVINNNNLIQNNNKNKIKHSFYDIIKEKIELFFTRFL